MDTTNKKEYNVFYHFALIIMVEYMLGTITTFSGSTKFKCLYLSAWTYIHERDYKSAQKYYNKLIQFYDSID